MSHLTDHPEHHLDADGHCLTCDALPDHELTLAELALARRRCQSTPWPEHHPDKCEWCAYLASETAIAATPRRTWTGIIGRIGVDTKDGRRIEPGAITLREGGVPLLQLGPEEGLGLSRIVGSVGQIIMVEGENGIHASGETSLAAGRYLCGMDLIIDGSVTDWARAPFRLTIHRARLAGLTIYPEGSASEPAWADVWIVVAP